MCLKPVDFVIITPLAEERDAVLKQLTNFRKEPPSKDDIRVYYSGLLPVRFADGSQSQYSIILLPLGKMGHTEAASATGDAIRRWQARYVLLVGIAGGMVKTGIKLGDVLISEQIVDYELATIREDGHEIRWQVHSVDQRLLIAAQNFDSKNWQQTTARRYDKKVSLAHFGPICTGNKVITDKSLADQFSEVWAKLIGCEMEAGGVANAAFKSVHRPGFFMIRGVSDLADGKKDSRHVKRWRPYACEIAAAFTIDFLKSGPVPIETNNNTIIEALLKQGADVNAKDDNGESALLFAAKNGQTEMVQLLLIKGANVNLKTPKRTTALMVAVYKCHKDVVEVLLAQGADVNSRNRSGETALRQAIKAKSKPNCKKVEMYNQIIQLLKKHGATE